MTQQTAKTIIRSINRWARRTQPFHGGRQYGVDYATWTVCYPHLAHQFQRAVECVTGRSGRFLPKFP